MRPTLFLAAEDEEVMYDGSGKLADGEARHARQCTVLNR
jgi:hypothetical protein